MPAPFVENAVFFPLDGFALVKDQVTIGVWVHFWVFNSVPLNYLPVSVSIPCTFYHDCSVIQLEVRDSDSPRISFIIENSFHYPVLFCFTFFVIPDEFANCSMKNSVGILMGIALNL